MRKIILMTASLLLLLSLALPSAAFAANDFKDVKQYKEQINFLVNEGIIKGYEEDNTFRPEVSIKRVQAVNMILRAKGVTDYTAPDPGFTDLKPSDEEYPAVAKAVELGIINGKTNHKTGEKYFDTYATLTRAQMANILVRAYDLEGEFHKVFKDVPKSHESYDSISALAANNITKGYENGTLFKPYNDLSRQHFAVFMARLLDDRFIEAEPDLPLEDFSYIALGMTKKEVENAEPTKLYSESDNLLMYRNKTVLGHSADVLYEFENGRLSAINIFHDAFEENTEMKSLEKYFNKFSNKLSTIYGEPAFLDDDWYDDKNGNVLSAMWLGNQHDVLLTVQIKDDSTLGGMRISLE